MRPTDKAYNCDRCEEHTPDGEGRYYKDGDTALTVLRWSPFGKR